MEKATKWLIGKFVIIVIMLALLLIKKRDAQSFGVAIGMIVGIVAITFFRFKNPEKYKSDERLEKLGSRATLWSWTITFIVVISIYWLEYLEFISLTATHIITIVFWTMVITIILFRIYFIRKSDVK